MKPCDGPSSDTYQAERKQFGVRQHVVLAFVMKRGSSDLAV
jgi:hypothetical protein